MTRVVSDRIVEVASVVGVHVIVMSTLLVVVPV
jgi:hypothetical protein